MDTPRGMPAERWLQWNIGALTAYGTLLLGMGQADPTLPSLSVFAALTSILFTDRWHWFRLPRALGNLAAMLALTVCVFDFFQDRERQLLAIAHLLVYLQIILLYQQKSPRVYWQLIVLSLLQVVVAAALNEHINFGILLVGYLFTSLMAISRLFILRESLRAAQLGVTVVGPVHPALRGSTRIDEAVSYIAPLHSSTQAEQAAASRASQRMLGWPWATDLAVFCAGTLCAAFLFFFMTPRVGGDSWEADTLGSQVGFNPDDVSLNDFGQIQQSETVVMRVALVDPETERPMQVDGELFLRGAVKSLYRNKGWSNSKISHNWEGAPLPEPASSNLPMVRQEFTLEPSGHEFLFHVSPAIQGEDPLGDRALRPHSLEMQRGRGIRGEFRYSMLTSGFDRFAQRSITPQYAWFRSARERARFESLVDVEMLEFNASENPTVQQISSDLVNQLGPSAGDRYSIAKALEAYFIEPGRFEYTLDPQVARIAGNRDPVEVFLTEVKSGHCEYFASALALMLRSQGIPSRLVIGYYGGEYNVVGGYYVVKEKYAHAWVEAYLRPEDIPPGMLPPGTDLSHGAWLRLNPTPESIASVEIEQTLFTRISETLDYVEMMWREYVLNLDAERQVERIYGPLQSLANNVRAFFNGLSDQRAWNNALAGVASRMGFDIRGQLRQIEWFYWPAGLVVIGLGVVGIVVLKVGKKVQQTIDPTARQVAHREKPPLFYDRFERLAKRHRLVRGAGETPREFAERVVEALTANGQPAEIAALPSQIVAALYQVRFSGQPLGKAESETIDAALVKLSEALRRGGD